MRMITALLVLPLLGCELIVGIEDPTLPDSGSGDSHSACTSQCMGDELVTCTDGTPQRSMCELGCSAEGTPHCRQITPSNGALLSDLDLVTGGLVLNEDGRYKFNTDTGEIKLTNEDFAPRERAVSEPGIIVRAATPNGGLDSGSGTYLRLLSDTVAVLVVDSFKRQADGPRPYDMFVAGKRALIILSRNDVTLDGKIFFDDVGAGEGQTTYAYATGCAPGQRGQRRGDTGDAAATTGGGGGGFGQPGAPGGNGTGTMPNPGGSGGAPNDQCPGPELVPLMGGSGGGAGSDSGNGGQGGAAFQVISLTRIMIGTKYYTSIQADGEGGSGSAYKGGGGGGSGGGILLEAPMVILGPGGELSAVGAGGGAGTYELGIGYRAHGGKGTGENGIIGRGGDGGTGDTPATAGGGSVNGAGGGGGGAGIIRINATTVRIDENAKIEPKHTQGDFTK